MKNPYSMIVAHNQSPVIDQYRRIADTLGLRLIQFNPIVTQGVLEHILQNEDPDALVVVADSFRDDMSMLVEAQFTDLAYINQRRNIGKYPTLTVPRAAIRHYEDEVPFPVFYHVGDQAHAFMKKSIALRLMYKGMRMYNWALTHAPEPEEMEEIMHHFNMRRCITESVWHSEESLPNNIISVNFSAKT